MLFQLYYRENCHLCDAMRKALVAFNSENQPVSWVEIDIDRDKGLIELYDSKVPVLCFTKSGSLNQELCYYFFDEAAVLKAIG